MVSTNLICVVDDSADYRLLLQHIFNRHFPTYNVHFFDSGFALFDALIDLRPKPSFILLDRHMPHLDGHQILLTLKGSVAYKRIPIVMMSADASDVEINSCYEAGANSFLMKKLDFTLLKKMIEGACHYWLEINLEPIEV